MAFPHRSVQWIAMAVGLVGAGAIAGRMTDPGPNPAVGVPPRPEMPRGSVPPAPRVNGSSFDSLDWAGPTMTATARSEPSATIQVGPGVTWWADSVGGARTMGSASTVVVGDGAVIAAITGVGDNAHLHHTFTLERSTTVRIEALGEGIDGTMYDYASLREVDARRPVWVMSYGATVHAGGAEKNRAAAATVRLPAGTYVLAYVTDDSHSADHWNAAPPREANRYGVTITRR